MTAPVIHTVSRLVLALRPWPWPFAQARREEIIAHFEALQRDKPQLWNGRVLLARQPEISGDVFTAEYFETDFASFLAWRDWGFPDPAVFNGFGMGALRGNDGAFVLGEMAAHTANAGKVYFPSGTPDLSDVLGESVDIAGSVAREVAEETGLTEVDYRADVQWNCVRAGCLIALIRGLDIDLPAQAVRERILRNLGRQTAPELSAIHLVRGKADLTPAMPGFVTAFLEAAFTT